MSFYIEIPHLNPIKFYPVDPGELPTYKYRHFDVWLNKIQTKEWEYTQPYLQKWEIADIVRIQVLAQITPLQLQLYTCSGEAVSGFTFSLAEKSTTLSGVDFRVYEAAVAFDDLDEGQYYFVLTAGSDDTVEEYVSEPMDIAEKHEGTVLIECTNSKNDFDVIFKRVESGNIDYLTFGMRVEAALIDFKPGGKATIYEDQRLNTVNLKSQSFRSWTLVVGAPTGVADWVIDKFHRFFDCDTVKIDGKGFVRPEGASFEATRAELYQHAGWRMEVREADNRDSKRFTGEVGELSSQLTVVYDLDTDGFGAQNGPASENIVQIEEING